MCFYLRNEEITKARYSETQISEERALEDHTEGFVAELGDCIPLAIKLLRGSLSASYGLG